VIIGGDNASPVSRRAAETLRWHGNENRLGRDKPGQPTLALVALPRHCRVVTSASEYAIGQRKAASRVSLEFFRYVHAISVRAETGL
jgi:hypothetical protein